MDTFNIIAGTVTIASLFLSCWIYLESKRKESVEKERFNSLSDFLMNILNTSNAMANQASLIGAMADRDETTKKELKHLAVALLCTVNVIQESLTKVLAQRKNWSFGVPSVYLELKSRHDSNKIKTDN